VARLLSPAAISDVDVVVVGGGPAGLAAASALDHLDFVLLESADRLGGQLHSLARDDVWVNLGAHLLTGGGSAITRLAAECGVDVLPVPGIKTALWFDGRLHLRRRVEAYPFALPLTLRERWDLVRFGAMLRLGVEHWRRAGRAHPGESEAARTDRLRRYRSGRTFGQMMRGVSPRVASIFETAARRSAGEADRLTEGGALALFGALWVSRGSASVVNIAGGSGRFGEAWERRLGGRAITGATVTSVVEHEHQVDVGYRDRGGGERRLRARHVVVAVPAPQVAQVVAGLPEDVRRELDAVAYGAFVCVGVLTKPLPPMPWDGVYAIATPQSEFDMLFHHTNPVLNRPGGNRGPRSLMCYAGGTKAAELLPLDDGEIRRRFLAQLADILPQTAAAIDEAVVMKWRFGNCFPVRSTSIAGTERWNRRPGGRVALAGAYFAPLGGTLEAAARSGLESAGMLTSPGEQSVSSGCRPGAGERTFKHD
jgi:oxygen-dependent protoporphyrinogen oxidase